MAQPRKRQGPEGWQPALPKRKISTSALNLCLRKGKVSRPELGVCRLSVRLHSKGLESGAFGQRDEAFVR